MTKRPFHVSFDLDDCLVCYDPAVPREPNRVPLPLRPWFREPLRLGTKNLMEALATRGCVVSIFTTSSRSVRYVKWWFRWHGIRLRSVINSLVYDAVVKPDESWHRPSKFPKAFGIDLHVDDSEGVRREGSEHGFAVVVVSLDDENWTQRVIEAVEIEIASGTL